MKMWWLAWITYKPPIPISPTTPVWPLVHYMARMYQRERYIMYYKLCTWAKLLITWKERELYQPSVDKQMPMSGRVEAVQQFCVYSFNVQMFIYSIRAWEKAQKKYKQKEILPEKTLPDGQCKFELSDFLELVILVKRHLKVPWPLDLTIMFKW